MVTLGREARSCINEFVTFINGFRDGAVAKATPLVIASNKMVRTFSTLSKFTYKGAEL